MSSGEKKRHKHAFKKPRTDFVLLFGKYKGKFMSAVPVQYLDWLLGKVEGHAHQKRLERNLLKHLNTREEWRHLIRE